MKTAVVGLMAVGALLAAGPAATRPADLVERMVVIQFPAGAIDGPELGGGAVTYSRLVEVVGISRPDDVLKDAVGRVTKEPPAVPLQARMVMSGMPEALHLSRIEGRLMVKWDGTAGGAAQAEQVADAMAEIIRDRVGSAWDDVVARAREALPARKQEAIAATERLAKVRDQIATAEKNLRAETGRIDLSAAGMQAAQDALELERQKIELDLAGLKARQEGLQLAIAAKATDAADARKEDVALQALSKAVEASKARLDRVRQMYNAGQASSAEVTEAELAVLQAEARRAERANAAGGAAEAMAQWNRALTDASIDLREKEARLAAATKRLTALIDAAKQQAELDAARLAEAPAADQQANAEKRLRAVTQWLEKYGQTRPTVEVKGGGAAGAPAAE